MNVTETLHKEFTSYCQRLCGEQGRQTAKPSSDECKSEKGSGGAGSEQAEPGRT